MVFARFSRPVADIVYSRNAIVAPYQDITGFEFRVVNARENQLIELHAKVVFSRFESVDGRIKRIFTPLALERESVSFFPLNWTVVHPIDENSPLFGWTRERLVESNAEFLILLTAIDDTFAQTVHSRSSYAASESCGTRVSSPCSAPSKAPWSWTSRDCTPSPRWNPRLPPTIDGSRWLRVFIEKSYAAAVP
jgi:inward rectifier potassium channel